MYREKSDEYIPSSALVIYFFFVFSVGVFQQVYQMFCSMNMIAPREDSRRGKENEKLVEVKREFDKYEICCRDSNHHLLDNTIATNRYAKTELRLDLYVTVCLRNAKF